MLQRVRRRLQHHGLQSLDRALAVAKQSNVDLIVGLGGGSSMDCAKGVNFLLTNGGRMQDYWGIGKAERPLLPLIAVPTTAGTGSDDFTHALGYTFDFDPDFMYCSDDMTTEGTDNWWLPVCEPM